MNLSISDIENNLNSLSGELQPDLKKIISTEFSEDTECLDFEVKNYSYNWYIVCYPMDNDRNQTGSPLNLLENHRKTGIIIPSAMQSISDEHDYEIEAFCDENMREIIELIAKWLQKNWNEVISKSKFEISAFMMLIDETDKFNLKTGKWE